MTLMTFVTGGLGFWVPAYLRYRDQSPAVGMTIFGLITVVAGLVVNATWRNYCRSVALAYSRFVLLGLWTRNAHRVSSFRCHSLHSVSRSVDPDVSGNLLSVFEHRSIKHRSRECFAAGRPRATAFAANIFVIHAFGDVQAFWLLGYIGGHANMHVAFLFVSAIILASGVTWLFGVKYLPADTADVEGRTT